MTTMIRVIIHKCAKTEKWLVETTAIYAGQQRQGTGYKVQGTGGRGQVPTAHSASHTLPVTSPFKPRLAKRCCAYPIIQHH